MSKKEYIDAVNEIEVSENLKRDTFNKANQIPTQRKYNKAYPIASLALMCAIIMAIVLPNKSIAPINELPYSEVKETSQLSKVENFENLYAMLNKRAKDTNRYYLDDMLTTDSIQESATNSAEDIKSSSSNDYSKTNIQVEGYYFALQRYCFFAEYTNFYRNLRRFFAHVRKKLYLCSRFSSEVACYD